MCVYRTRNTTNQTTYRLRAHAVDASAAAVFGMQSLDAFDPFETFGNLQTVANFVG